MELAEQLQKKALQMPRFAETAENDAAKWTHHQICAVQEKHRNTRCYEETGNEEETEGQIAN